MSDRWSWLAGTFWIVPEANLAAPMFSTSGGDPVWLLDQTVWQITGYADGYFWGNTAAQMMRRPEGDDDATPSAQLLTGSVTPEGSIHMTFVPLSSTGGGSNVIGIGNMRRRDESWMAEMQMSTPVGSTQLVLHWAYMVQCTPDDPTWHQLPGTTQSLPEFLRAAGFHVVET